MSQSTSGTAPRSAGDANPRQSTDPATAALGEQLRRARRDQGLSLRQFASRSGMSDGLISQFERGMGNPSLLTLQKLAAGLGVPLIDLFHRANSSATTPAGAGNGLDAAQCAVVRNDGRKKLAFPHEDLLYELLTPDMRRNLAMMRVHLPAGFDGSAMPFQHHGEESVHILTGSLDAHVADDVHSIGEGDTITYQSSLPHWWRNPGTVPADVICAATPPSF